MGRAFEYRKAAKLKRWGHMARTFTKIGKQIAIAVKAGGPDPTSNSKLKDVIAKCKANNMPTDTIRNAIKKASAEEKKPEKLQMLLEQEKLNRKKEEMRRREEERRERD